MAKQVKLGRNKEFEFPTTKGGGQSKYPWDEWFNGTLLLIERSDVDADGNLVDGGEKRDYEVATDAMVPKLKTAARRRYKVVQISRKDADKNKLVNALIIQARNMDDAEHQAEDLQRAEEKAARKVPKDNPDPTDPNTILMAEVG